MKKNKRRTIRGIGTLQKTVVLRVTDLMASSERPISLCSLATASGIDKSHLSKIFRSRSRLNLEHIERLAAGLGIPATQLLPRK